MRLLPKQQIEQSTIEFPRKSSIQDQLIRTGYLGSIKTNQSSFHALSNHLHKQYLNLEIFIFKNYLKQHKATVYLYNSPNIH